MHWIEETIKPQLFRRTPQARLGKPEGLVATAHKLARILYGMITQGRAYDESEAFKATPASEAQAPLATQNS